MEGVDRQTKEEKVKVENLLRSFRNRSMKSAKKRGGYNIKMGIGREELLSGGREWIYIQCTERDFILLNGYIEQVMGSTGGGVDVSLCLWMCLSRKIIIGIRTVESLDKGEG